MVPLKERFQEFIAQPLDGTAGLCLSMFGRTAHVLRETMQGFSDLFPQLFDHLAYGGKRGLLLVLVLAPHGHELLLELMQFLFDLIPLALGFQGEPEFQRFETLMDIVLRRIRRGSKLLGLSVGRKCWHVDLLRITQLDEAYGSLMVMKERRDVKVVALCWWSMGPVREEVSMLQWRDEAILTHNRLHRP
jgi:hypothetical protein